MKSSLVLLSFAVILSIQAALGEETLHPQCDVKCSDECTCPERIVCTETEIDCGPSSATPKGHCDPDRVCVASNCHCRFLILSLRFLLGIYIFKIDTLLVYMMIFR